MTQRLSSLDSRFTNSIHRILNSFSLQGRLSLCSSYWIRCNTAKDNAGVGNDIVFKDKVDSHTDNSKVKGLPFLAEVSMS